MAILNSNPTIKIAGLNGDLIKIVSLSYSRNIRNVAGTWNATYKAVDVEKERSREGKLHKQFPKSLRALGGAEVSIVFNGTTLFSGFVDHSRRSTSESGVVYSVNGRSRSCDFCDQSLGYALKFKNVSLPSALRQVLEFYGMRLVLKTRDSFDKNLTFTCDPVASGFAAIDEHVRNLGVLLYETTSGNLVLADAGVRIANDIICEPIGFQPSKGWQVAKTFDCDIEFSGIASEYRVLSFGKAGKNGTPGIVLGSGNYIDDSVRTTKRRWIKAKTTASTADLTRRAEWEHGVAEARAVSMNVSLSGWTQTDGTPWRLNQLVRVVSPDSFGSDEAGQMLIVGIKQDWSEAGASTSLELADPGAYRREAITGRRMVTAKMRDKWVDKAAAQIQSPQPSDGKQSPSQFAQPTRNTGTYIDPDDLESETED